MKWVDGILPLLYTAVLVACIVTMTQESGTYAPVYREGTVHVNGTLSIIGFIETGSVDIMWSSILCVTFGLLDHLVSVLSPRFSGDNSSWNYRRQLQDHLLLYQFLDYVLAKPIMLCAIAIATSPPTWSGLSILFTAQVLIYVARFVCQSVHQDAMRGKSLILYALMIISVAADLVCWGGLLSNLETFGGSLRAGEYWATASVFVFTVIEIGITLSLSGYFCTSAVSYFHTLTAVQKICSFLARTIFFISLIVALAPDLWYFLT